MSTELADHTLGELIDDRLDAEEWSEDDLAAVAAGAILLATGMQSDDDEKGD